MAEKYFNGIQSGQSVRCDGFGRGSDGLGLGGDGLGWPVMVGDGR